MRIHPGTTLGPVHYTVADLDRQIEFYRDVLGFQLLQREDDSASLGTAKRELLRLSVDPQAVRFHKATGLYHTAFLVPTRRDLAQLLRRLIERRVPIQGTSNHGTHLAIYLPDPEGNGIELAWDFPQDAWPMRDGMMSLHDMPREGIDIESLMDELRDDVTPWHALPSDTIVGHVHLHVADLTKSEAFYCDLLGFDVTMKGDDIGALFVSAGGYHHHIGTNIWKGAGLPPAPDHALGLRYFTIVIPDEHSYNELEERINKSSAIEAPTSNGLLLRDPSNIGVVLERG